MPRDRVVAVHLERIVEEGRVDAHVYLNGQCLGVLLAPSPEDAAEIAVRLTTPSKADELRRFDASRSDSDEL